MDAAGREEEHVDDGEAGEKDDHDPVPLQPAQPAEPVRQSLAATFQVEQVEGTGEQQRRDAQTSLAEAEARLLASEQALEAARDQLTRDARDLDLPSDREGLERVAVSLAEYRTAAIELAGALRDQCIDR